jgi:hypothetical protein
LSERYGVIREKGPMMNINEKPDGVADDGRIIDEPAFHAWKLKARRLNLEQNEAIRREADPRLTRDEWEARVTQWLAQPWVSGMMEKGLDPSYTQVYRDFLSQVPPQFHSDMNRLLTNQLNYHLERFRSAGGQPTRVEPPRESNTKVVESARRSATIDLS